MFRNKPLRVLQAQLSRDEFGKQRVAQGCESERFEAARSDAIEYRSHQAEIRSYHLAGRANHGHIINVVLVNVLLSAARLPGEKMLDVLLDPEVDKLTRQPIAADVRD